METWKKITSVKHQIFQPFSSSVVDFSPVSQFLSFIFCSFGKRILLWIFKMYLLAIYHHYSFDQYINCMPKECKTEASILYAQHVKLRLKNNDNNNINHELEFTFIDELKHRRYINKAMSCYLTWSTSPHKRIFMSNLK